MTLIDTNIFLDVLTDDPRWANWSAQQLGMAALRGPLAINDLVYAEMSVRVVTIEALDAVLDDAGVSVQRMPRAALFLAGKVFQRYPAAGGPRTSILPDFSVGAHAAVSGWRLLTRDVRRYRAYFPSLDLVSP